MTYAAANGWLKAICRTGVVLAILAVASCVLTWLGQPIGYFLAVFVLGGVCAGNAMTAFVMWSVRR